MSRFVAGFALLYVCAVSGQQDRNIHQGRAISDKTSIAIDSISGGNYPAGAFSIGYGGEIFGRDGKPGASYGVHNSPRDEENNNGLSGVINGDFGHGHTGNNGYDHTGYRPISSNAAVQNYNDRPNGYSEYGQRTVAPPISNSATRNRFYDSVVRFLLSWF